MKYTEVEPVESVQKYNIQFGRIFTASLLVMILSEVISYFEALPEIFTNGDIVYHLASSFISLMSQLAASIAAAVIFYYCLEFINKSKAMGKYTDIRRDFLFIVYKHIELLSQLDDFKHISLKNTGKRTHDIRDISQFIQRLNVVKNDYDSLFQSVKQLLKKKGELTNEIIIYKRHLESIDSKSDFPYMRNFYKNLEETHNYFEELDQWNEIFFNADREPNAEELDVQLTKAYLNFMLFTTDFYIDLNSFMTVVNQKKVLDFLRMVD